MIYSKQTNIEARLSSHCIPGMQLHTLWYPLIYLSRKWQLQFGKIKWHGPYQVNIVQFGLGAMTRYHRTKLNLFRFVSDARVLLCCPAKFINSWITASNYHFQEGGIITGFRNLVFRNCLLQINQSKFNQLSVCR